MSDRDRKGGTAKRLLRRSNRIQRRKGMLESAGGEMSERLESLGSIDRLTSRGHDCVFTWLRRTVQSQLITK